MAKGPAEASVDFRKLTEHILDSYLNSSSEEGMEVLELLDEGMSVIGTGKQEFFRNLQEFSQAFVFEVEQREKVRFEWTNLELEEQRIDEEHVLVYGSALIVGTFPGGNVGISMDSRFTILYGLAGGSWKVLHIHHSVPDKEQMQDEEFPRTLGRQVEESQSMVAALTADYLNVYVIEPEVDRASILKLDGYVVAGIHEAPKDFSYSEMLRKYANDRVFDEDRDGFVRIILPQALVKTFADGRERLELNYRVPAGDGLEHYSALYSRISKKGEPLLEEAGMTVDSAQDGDVAVATIDKAPSDRYDLVFMDIQMPKMDGYTATREIRTLSDNRKANIPIVAMTANAFEEDRQRAYKAGMNGHIIKPISIEAIAKVLDETL